MLSLFSFITYGVGIVCAALFFNLDGHYIVKNNVVIAWNNIRRINNLVSTKHKSYCKILWISLYMVCQALWMNLNQHLNNTIEPLEGNKYLVSYIIKGNVYKIIVKQKRGPRAILLVYDETHTDVSDVIFQYLGPEENFHGYHYTPRFFGKEELVFELSNGTEKIFRADQQIKFD